MTENKENQKQDLKRLESSVQDLDSDIKETESEVRKKHREYIEKKRDISNAIFFTIYFGSPIIAIITMYIIGKSHDIFLLIIAILEIFILFGCFFKIIHNDEEMENKLEYEDLEKEELIYHVSEAKKNSMLDSMTKEDLIKMLREEENE